MCGCTGTPVTGLHISRFLCHTFHSTVSFSPASTGQTHHLSPLDTRPACRRTLREKERETITHLIKYLYMNIYIYKMTFFANQVQAWVSRVNTHSVCPIREVPISDTRTHVTVLGALWAEPVIALPVTHSAPMVTDTAYTPGSLSHSTIHWTLWEKMHHHTCRQLKHVYVSLEINRRLEQNNRFSKSASQLVAWTTTAARTCFISTWHIFAYKNS